MTGSPPRVLHVCTSTDRRGAETFATTLATTLAEDGSHHDLVALRPGTTDAVLDLPTLGATSRGPRTLRALRGRIGRADVVVAHGSDTLLAVALASLGTGVPYAYVVIGDPDVWGDVPLARFRVGAPLRRAAAVVTLWAGAGDSVARRYGVDPARVHVIPNGRDHRRFRPPSPEERAEARTALVGDRSGPVIGWIGALSPEKDPLTAVEVAALVPEAQLVVAGDGPLRTELDLALAGTDGQALGTVPDTRPVLWGLDVLLLTSRTEGVPGIAVEAGLCGVPVVAPAVGGLPDLVDATTGALVAAGVGPGAYAEAIRALLPEVTVRGAALAGRCRDSATLEVATHLWSALLVGLAAEG